MEQLAEAKRQLEEVNRVDVRRYIIVSLPSLHHLSILLFITCSDDYSRQ